MRLIPALFIPTLVSAHAAPVESWVTYQSQVLGVEVVAPMHWKEDRGERSYRLLAPDVEESGATVTVSKAAGSLTEAMQRGRKRITTILQDGRLISESSSPQNGHQGYVLKFSATDQGLAIIGTLNFIELGGQVFLVDCEAHKDAYARYRGMFQKTAASLYEYARSGKHLSQSGSDIPSSWTKHQNNRLKISAQAPHE
jgi:hypothetical protein